MNLFLLKSYICFLIVVSGVSVVGYKLDKILKRMVVVYLIFEKMLELFFFVFVYLSLISSLLFKMLIVGINLDINGIPMILCLISVI